MNMYENTNKYKILDTPLTKKYNISNKQVNDLLSEQIVVKESDKVRIHCYK